MSVSSGYLKKIGYLVLVFIIIAFWGCGGRNLPGGSEYVTVSDIVISDIQTGVDSSEDVKTDICIPNCFNKECGDDGCGGSCGVCGDNAGCNVNICECNNGFSNCNNDWSDGCEINLNSINSCGTSCSNRVVCSSMNGINPICDNGVCKLTCKNGYVDCNSGVANSDGCEKQMNPEHLWSKRFGGSSSDYGSSVSVDSSGNVYITGYFHSSTIDFGGGALTNAGGNCAGYLCDDIFLAKFDSNGNHLWSKNFGGSISDFGVSIAIDKVDNVYITGNFLSYIIEFGGSPLTNAGISNIFIAKFDSNGNHLWSKSFGESGVDIGNSVSIDNSGNVYITGIFSSSTIDFGGSALTNAGKGDIFLTKFDSNGNHKWSKNFGGSTDDIGHSISIDNSDNVYLTGYFNSSTLDFGGRLLTSAGKYDIFLAKFDSNGNYIWGKSFGGGDWDYGLSTSVDRSGNVYITGYFHSSSIDFGGGALTNAGGSCGSYPCSDIFLAKFDSNGNHKWSKRFGGSSDDRGYSVFVDSSGNVYLTGYFDSSTIDFGGGALNNAGSNDIFLAKFDSNGNHKWSKRFGGSSEDWGNSVSVDSSGNVYGIGSFASSNVDFGGCPLSSAGGSDIYLIKYAP